MNLRKMADLQALFPVYLPKALTENDTQEDYDASVTQNENNLNQNFTILFNAISDLNKSLSKEK